MTPALPFAALADDLTGAVELTAMLRAGGARAKLVVRHANIPAERGAADALVVALRTRVGPAAEAVLIAEQAGSALRRLGARMLFLKYCATFDSLPTGNIGNMAEALGRAGPAAPVLFCPSFPEAGRTVYHAHLFVHDQLLSDSPKRHDPLTPMTQPDLRRVLAPQTTEGVGFIPLEFVLDGPKTIRRHAEGEHAAGRRFLIADAVTEANLRALAEAAVDWPLLTGGSSVAAHLPALWRQRGLLPEDAPAPLAPVAGPGIVLAGSCAERTGEQIAAFGRSHPVLELDPLLPIEGSIEHALAWAGEKLGSGPVCLATGADPARVAQAQAALGPVPAGRRAEALLATLAARLVERGVRRLVVAGGETSGAVVEALGIRELDVAAYRRIGVGLCRAESPVPVMLCLKSGKLGSVDMFGEALAEMEGVA